MRHHNSVFHDLTKHIPWRVFDRLVEKHQSDFRTRRLDSKSQFLALLFAQLSGASSLREIEAGLLSHRARLYHLGGKCAARSTLGDANAKRSWQLFGDLFATMAASANRSTRRKMADGIRILDSTKFKLSSLSADWAYFSKDLTAAKLHIVYDPDKALPLVARITPDNVNDITLAKQLEIEPGATYVFDLAYYDYGWWAKMHAQGCRFVSRLKTSTPITVNTRLEVEPGSDILSDCIGHLPQRQARNHRNPMSDPVREIKVRISTGKIIRLVCNDLNASAQEIADLYKQRWQIELFFKWVKQNLKIKHFIGTSENAIRTQLFVAMITYLLLHMAHAAQSTIKKTITFIRLVRINLMHRRSINTLKQPQIPPPINTEQISMEWG